MAEEACASRSGWEAKRMTGTGQGPKVPFKCRLLNNLTSFHWTPVLEVLPPPNSATDWGLRLRHMSLWGDISVQTIADRLWGGPGSMSLGLGVFLSLSPALKHFILQQNENTNPCFSHFVYGTPFLPFLPILQGPYLPWSISVFPSKEPLPLSL
jgi:hypothetical protein